MLGIQFISWWYSAGWQEIIKSARRRIIKTYQLFSISLLLTTLIQPWHRIITYPGQTIGERARALVDNAVSRLVGLVVRLIVLFYALLLILLVALISGLEIIVWPALPLAAIAAVIRGIV